MAKALNDSRGSASEYRDVIRGLYAIESSLSELDTLCRSSDPDTTYAQLGEVINQEIVDCRTLLADYRKRIEKYERGLKEGGSGSKIKDGYSKIRWRINQKDFVSEFTLRLQTRIQAIDLLTTTLQLAKTDISDERLQARLDEISTKITESHHDALLSSLKSEIERNNSLIEGQVRSFQWFTLPNVRKFSLELLDRLRNIGTVGQETLQEVKWISSHIPRPLQPWSEPPVLLNDAFGHIVPIPVDFVTSWGSFQALLNNRFLDWPGGDAVKQQNYILEDGESLQQFGGWQRWEAVFRPGRIVKMSIVLNCDKTPVQTCPSCDYYDERSSDRQIECASCNLEYRHTTELVDVPMRPRPKNKYKERRNGSVRGFPMVANPDRFLGRDALSRKLWDTNPEENQIRKFRRVYLVSIENTKVTKGALIHRMLPDPSRSKSVFANCLCGLNEEKDDSEDCVQCTLCGTHQHLECHGVRQPSDTLWRCLRCHFIINGQRQTFDKSLICPIMDCRFFSRRVCNSFAGVEATLSHLLSHEDLEITCTFCIHSPNGKLPIFTHAHVYRTHLAFVHGASVLNTVLPRVMDITTIAPKHSDAESSGSTATCSLCKGFLKSVAEAAEHVNFCAARRIIQRSRMREILDETVLDSLDKASWTLDHDAFPFDPELVGEERDEPHPSFRPKQGEEGLYRANLSPAHCRAGCYGAPKGQTKEENERPPGMPTFYPRMIDTGVGYTAKTFGF
ncbi:MAG: hypothetical protein Q9165_001132 [Trypethelium subeluteriae]